MSVCLVCLNTADEATLKPRYMLPCCCELILCDECVKKIMICPYHRARQRRSLEGDEALVHMLETIKHERARLIVTLEDLSNENKVQRKCCIVLAFATIVFIVCKDVLYLLNSTRYSWVVSTLALMWSLLMYGVFSPGSLADMYKYVWKVAMLGVALVTVGLQ
jgi:hypothetical protein